MTHSYSQAAILNTYFLYDVISLISAEEVWPALLYNIELIKVCRHLLHAQLSKAPATAFQIKLRFGLRPGHCTALFVFSLSHLLLCLCFTVLLLDTVLAHL